MPNKKTTKYSAKPSSKRKRGKFKLAYTNRKTTKLLSESATNELSKDDLSFLTEEEKLLLSSWDLPSTVLAKYRAKGITSLFKWQLECLANENVLKGNNLVYSAPTSAGKTLVAEILMIKRVLELGRKAILILPFVALAREKMYSLQELYGDAGIRVEGFMGSYNPPGGFKAVDVAVCTIEKANSLINRLLEEGDLQQLGTIVVDELHLLGDPNRGYLLELLLTKIRYMTSCKLNQSSRYLAESENTELEKTNSNNLNIQVIGMSATLPNLKLVANWLSAELLVTDFRPVPLIERIKIGNSLFDTTLNPIRPVYQDTLPISIPNDPDDVVYLALETVSEGHSLIIFCPTKRNCEQVAEQIAREFYNIGNPESELSPEVGEALRRQLNGVHISDVLTQLSQCPGGVDEVLAKCIAFGIAFHHAGLTYDERDIVESSFKRGIIRVVVATSTLSAGVNLPARRVLIKMPQFNGINLDILTYRQMSGRAGRQGIDTEGESVLICSGSAAKQSEALQLFQSSLPAVTSALVGNSQDGEVTSCMKRAIIEIISSGIAVTPSQIQEYSTFTLLHQVSEEEVVQAKGGPSSSDSMKSALEDCLQFLVANDFIRLNKFEDPSRENEYAPTQLGSACLASSLSPDESIVVFKELEKARRCFVLENELHVVYQVTPIYLADQWKNIDWNQFLNVWQDLTLHERKVAELVGVEESFILRAMVGIVSRKNVKQAGQLAVHQRFFTALALNDLVNEMSLSDVADKYGVTKGIVQNLQQAASTFAGMVTVFCSRLGWSNLELLLSQFQERLQFGIQRELCDLVRLDVLNGQKARILYNSGIKSIAELAASEPSRVEQILHKAGPFRSAAHGQCFKPVWVLGKKEGLSEKQAADLIIRDARQFLQIELGLSEDVQFLCNSPEKARHIDTELLNCSRLNKSKIINLSSRSFAQVDDPVLENKSKEENTNEYSELLASNVQQDVKPDEAQAKKLDLNKTWCHLSIDKVFEDSFNDIISELRGDSEFQEKNRLEMSFENREYSLIACDASSRNLALIADMLEKETNANANKENASPDQKIQVQAAISNHENANQDADALMTSILSMMETSFHMSWDGENEVSGTELKVQLLNENDLKDQDQDKTDANALDDESIKNVYKPNFIDKLCPEKIPEEFEIEILSKSRRSSSSSNEIMNDSFTFDGGAEEQKTFGAIGHHLQSTPKRTDKVESCNIRNSSKPNADTEEGFDKFDSFLGELSFENPRQISFEFPVGPGHGQILKLKIVDDPSGLPDDLFNGTNIVGIGLNLHKPKRSSSTPRSLIGNKILGRRFSLSNSTQRSSNTCNTHSEEEQCLGIGMYNGLSDTIWCYRWSQSEKGRILRPGKCNIIQINNQARVVRLFERFQKESVPLAIADAKSKMKSLANYCGKHLPLSLENKLKVYDPKIANWLIQTDENKFMSLEEMADSFLDSSDRSLRTSSWKKDGIDAYFSYKVIDVLKNKLVDLKLWKHFTDVEMPIVKPLTLMELNGFGLDSTELERLKKILEFEATVLELRAYQIAGKQFNVNSPKDIRQVLREVGLTPPGKEKGTGRDVLSKFDHELPKAIMECRKVTHTLKTVCAFLGDRSLETKRIHGLYSHFTLTGRVIMSEPSLQCIPRDFYVNLGLTSSEIEKLRHDCNVKFGLKFTTLLSRLENNYDIFLKEIVQNKELKMSLRNAFVPNSDNYTLLSADYAQLELRILANLCEDENLSRILNNSSGDVFRSISSRLNGIPEYKVTDELRQEAKVTIYGIIYGMGSKALSEQLDIDETTAAQYISQFMKTFPKIRSFIDSTVKFCRQQGFVETLTGRRRYLDHINSRNITERAQAERQAINSRVQGSASDLVKMAMNRIHNRLGQLYPETLQGVPWSEFCTKSYTSLDLPCFPILNLHDELIFEVKKSCLPQVANEIKVQMESSLDLKLKIRIPVVVKTGPTWAKLTPYN